MSNSMEKQTKTTKKRSSKSENYEKQIYDLKQLLEISKSLCSLLDYDNLIESVLYVCMCQVHTLGAGLFVAKDFSSDKIELGNHFNGLEVDENIDYSISKNHPFVDFLNANPNAYTLEELEKKFPNQRINLYHFFATISYRTNSREKSHCRCFAFR